MMILLAFSYKPPSMIHQNKNYMGFKEKLTIFDVIFFKI